MKSLRRRLPTLLFLAVTLSPHPANGQAQERERRLVDQFDADKDGILSEQERRAARAFVKANPQRRGPGGRGRGPGAGRGGSSGPQPTPGPEMAPADVETIPEKQAGLYKANVLRTIFLEFKQDEWEDELADFYRTDVMVPADMIVDGQTYENVGVGFRGNSSFFTLGRGQKRSFNITMDFADSRQDLYGYRTLNLLNGHADPSFLREVLYNRIARNYTAAPKGNFVRLVINGRSWGIYSNIQQQNRDFTEQWFGSRNGVRWKVSPGPGSESSSLKYNGPDERSYGGYQLKSKPTPAAHTDLIRFLQTLNETPIEQLHEKLEDVMSVDAALWFLALDNTLIDTDGYYSRGSDFMLYQQPDDGRFHVLLYDSNETFRTAGHGGPPGGPGGRPGGGPPRGPRRFPDNLFRRPPQENNPGRTAPPPPRGGNGTGGDRRPGSRPGGESSTALDLSPFAGEDKENFGLTSRLLKNPIVRARYVAHVRTITREWLDWKTTGALITEYRELIDAEVKQDTRKLYSYENFVTNLTSDISGRRVTPGLERFVRERGDFLRKHPDLSRQAPTLSSVKDSVGKNSFTVTAQVKEHSSPLKMILYSAAGRHLKFTQTMMHDDGEHADGEAGDGVYGATVSASGRHYYYVESRTLESQPVTSFSPAGTERAAIAVQPDLGSTPNFPVVINEVMAANTRTIQDTEGEPSDWIELRNNSPKEVDLSGLHLTDTTAHPRKWQFPQGTKIAASACLLVWADEDTKDPGLHASFKLSRSGETVYLTDVDGRQILDSITFPESQDDEAFGRLPDTTEIQPVSPTPGAQNKPHE